MLVKIKSVEDIAPAELLSHLRQHRRVDIEQWHISLDVHGIWMTNPYGVDCKLLGANESGCERVLQTISRDEHEREWC